LAVDFVAASATAGDRRAVVLDTTSGKRLCAERALRSAHLSSDGRTVVLARDGGEIALLDATSGRERTRLRFEPAAVAALALDRGTGRIAALGGRELDVYGPSGAVEQRLELAELSSGALAFAPDGATLYLAHGQAVRAFEVATGNEPVAVLGHVSKVRTVAVSADGALALTGGADATVRLWDAQSGQQLGLLGGHGAPVTVVVVAPDGSVGASAADDGSVRLWDLRARRELRDLVGHERSWPVRALALSADGRLLCSGGDYSEAKLWEVASGDLVRSIDWPTGSVRVAWVGFADQAGRELVTVSDGGQLERWDLASSPPARLGGWVLAPEPVALALGADRNELLAASGDGAIVLRKVADGSEIVRLTGAPSPTSVLLAAGRMVSGHADGRVRLWPTAGGPERAFATRGGAVLALGLGGSDRLLVGQQDTTATVWRLRPEAATR
jgi:WD40 repeat protein